MIRIERHRLGPRFYALGRRIHECHLGLAVLVAAPALWALGVLHELALSLLVIAGIWLVVKDWRDLFLRTRDTAAWRLGIHRRVNELRALPRGAWVPPLAAAAAAVTALVNLVSALTPNMAWRGHMLLQLAPVGTVPIFHALALPVSGCLGLAAVYLAKRRRRAWQVAVLFLVALGAVNLLKGLDVEEALLSWGVAGLLWWGREAFSVLHDPIGPRSALWRVPALGLATGGLAAVAATVAAPAHAGLGLIARETAYLLLWSDGPIHFHDELLWVPLGVGLASACSILAGVYFVFRPLAAPRRLPDPRLRRAAAALVRAHGSDTLAFFKLRLDNQYLFAADRRAFVGYRVENGVLLVSGDPVGPPDALPELVRQTCSFAEQRGLKVAALGASADVLPLWQAAGLRSLYIGDEAVVDTASFSLEGRAIRKVRQSVSRLDKAGYQAGLLDAGALDEAAVTELEALADRWRAGAPERGFAMAMDSLRGAGGIVLAARDGEGALRGFLHFVPVSGRPALSLSSMCRDHGTPNGLSEFLVARAIELLREDGFEELSLNFAAFARLMHAPCGPLECALGRVVALANPFFQIESLYRFNAKFFPRWEPRYLVYERALALPRVGLAAMWAEGQLRKPRLRRAA